MVMLTHAEYTLPLEVVEFDHDMDRLPEWWILDAKGKKIARFFDRYAAKYYLKTVRYMVAYGADELTIKKALSNDN